MTNDDYHQRQRIAAEQFAPPSDISEQEFVYRASFYDLPTLRQASGRYGKMARGRNHGQVLERYLEILRNPNINRSDDLRIALGHIEATRRRMEEIEARREASELRAWAMGA